jgi:hypothetical protein
MFSQLISIQLLGATLQGCSSGTSRSYTPNAIKYLDDHHNRIWYKSRFSKDSKCDYLTNNISESFNSQVRDMKGLLIHELLDGLRDMIMERGFLGERLVEKWVKAFCQVLSMSLT